MSRFEFDADGLETDDGGALVREVPAEELDDLRPKGAKSRHDFFPSVTASLDRALRYFLLSTAARRVRGKGNRHATALVHTSQHVDVHRKTAAVIVSHIDGLARRLAERDTALLSAFEEQWLDEVDRVPAEGWGLEPVAWDDVAALLATVAEEATVITDNSQSEERLSFSDETPRVIIAVGGNTLSRGLTLEGLAVSFFVRTASAYDTLLADGPLVRLPQRLRGSDADLDDCRDARVVPPPRHGGAGDPIRHRTLLPGPREPRRLRAEDPNASQARDHRRGEDAARPDGAAVVLRSEDPDDPLQSPRRELAIGQRRRRAGARDVGCIGPEGDSTAGHRDPRTSAERRDQAVPRPIPVPRGQS